MEFFVKNLRGNSDNVKFIHTVTHCPTCPYFPKMEIGNFPGKWRSNFSENGASLREWDILWKIRHSKRPKPNFLFVQFAGSFQNRISTRLLARHIMEEFDRIVYILLILVKFNKENFYSF